MSNPDDKELQKIVDYWNARKRRNLSNAEWHDFYNRVVAKLMQTRLPAEYQSFEARRDLIQAFFAEKILANARTTTAGDLQNAHVLHGHLKRFAIDQLSDLARVGLVDAGDAPITIDHDEQAIDVCITELSHDEKHLLSEAGIDLEAACVATDELLATLGEGERLMLRHHTCEDHERREPMDALAKRCQIASYHYKAKKLGITGQKGGFFQGYEHTTLGGWLKKLGAEISPAWQRELLTLINLLCLRVRQVTEGAK